MDSSGRSVGSRGNNPHNSMQQQASSSVGGNDNSGNRALNQYYSGGSNGQSSSIPNAMYQQQQQQQGQQQSRQGTANMPQHMNITYANNNNSGNYGNNLPNNGFRNDSVSNEARLKQLQQMQFQNRQQQFHSPSQHGQINNNNNNNGKSRRTSGTGTPLQASPALARSMAGYNSSSLLPPPPNLARSNSRNASTGSGLSNGTIGLPMSGPPSTFAMSSSPSKIRGNDNVSVGSNTKSPATKSGSKSSKPNSNLKKPPPGIAQTDKAVSSSSSKTDRVASKGDAAANSATLKSKSNDAASLLAGEDVTRELLQKCDWQDKTLWICRHLLGGQVVNGFLRSTATVQRIKKQRARQIGYNKSKKDGEESVSSNITSSTGKKADATGSSSAKKRDGSEQEAEEELKKQVMNVRTAKKIKLEMEAGVSFCKMLHDTIQSVLGDMNVKAQPPPLDKHLLDDLVPAEYHLHGPPSEEVLDAPDEVLKETASATSAKKASSSSTTANTNSKAATDEAEQSAASPGDPSGSTLRKQRKKKLPPNPEPTITLPEFDSSGKRLFTKKEHANRLFEANRYRPLKVGDYVAARLTSRDLWILAKVLKEYSGPPVDYVDLLQLSDIKRAQLFKTKVLVKDVEDKTDDGSNLVARNLILPLPRNYSEAAEWCSRLKKGYRVYAMYPQTTSLYSATVIDSNTYCRNDDDIVVVEFDGDEPDATGAIPKCHIPARFVTFIPSEFPGSKSDTKKSKKASAKASSNDSFSASDDILLGSGDFLDSLDDLKFDDNLGIELGDLDFDLEL